MQRDRPFTFLDHALKVGDSLLGVGLKQLEAMTTRPSEETGTLLLPWLHEKVERVRAARKNLAMVASQDTESVQRKAWWLKQADSESYWLAGAANVLLLAELRRLDKKPIPEADWDNLLNVLQHGAQESERAIDTLRAAQASLGRSPMNWEITFPDVFASGGFDSIIGNPPISSVLWQQRCLAKTTCVSSRAGSRDGMVRPIWLVPSFDTHATLSSLTVLAVS